jgi:hypothetical protein
MSNKNLPFLPENSSNLTKQERILAYKNWYKHEDKSLYFHLSFLGDDLGFSKEERLEFFDKFCELTDRNDADTMKTLNGLREIIKE